MALSTGETLGVALLAGSVIVVLVLIILILLGVDSVIELWDGGIDLVFELAGGVRETLFGVE